MCFDEQDCIPRRAFLQGAAAAVAGAAVRSVAEAQQAPPRALDDPEVIHGAVSFKNGVDTINGYLARPKRRRRSRAVIILHGNLGIPQDHRNTAAQMAQSGFLGLVVSSTSREGLDIDPTIPDANSREPDPSVITREFAYSYRLIKRYMGDAQSGIEYLKSQPFFETGGVGLIAFCGGGVTALTFATISADLKAVIALYAAPISHPPNISTVDPRPNPISLVDRITLPLQCHYGTNDGLIPMTDVKKFQQALQEHKVPHEMYLYEGAGHGFYDYTRSNYDPKPAILAHRRMLRFLKRHLK